jgi:hypothetical protein
VVSVLSVVFLSFYQSTRAHARGNREERTTDTADMADARAPVLPSRLPLAKTGLGHTGIGREFTGEHAGMNIGAVLAQAAQERGAGVAGRALGSVYNTRRRSMALTPSARLTIAQAPGR